MKKIICLGNATWDQTFTMKSGQNHAKKAYASAFFDCGGGVAATASVAIAKHYHPVEFIGRIGGDFIGEQIVHELSELNVSVEHCLKHENAKSSIATVIVGDEQFTSRNYVFNDPNMPKDTSSLFNIDLSEVCAIVADVTWPEAVTVMFERAKAMGIPTFLRVSFYSNEITRLMSLADYCVMNHPSLLAMTTDINHKRALKKAHNQIGGVIIVTLSNRGCAWFADNEFAEVPAEKVEVVDTTGAGDVYIGVFALHIGLGQDVASAAEMATKAASRSCMFLGARQFSHT